ncbi:alpha/beta fold hydrolase [Thalassobacillus hwangdonensis]|uniref:Alpha/beta fold hydrolase n=1 Tax=Thalassobacillus hwangdonensis TaxID=546108 RepID=A0ABW3L887_9BACI
MRQANSVGKKVKKGLKITGITLVTIVVFLLVAGFVYEKANYNRVDEVYPPDGEMMSVGGKQLHVNVEGVRTSLPTVIIEAGTGNWSYDWSYVQDQLAERTRVITYDRAGYGYSDAPGEGFSLDGTVEDLRQVMEAADVTEPVILVGHSAGGLYTRLFAEKYPDKVAGMVLVDARNEFFEEKAPEYNKAFFDTQDQTFNRLLASIGVVRFLGQSQLDGQMPYYVDTEKYVNVHWDAPFFKVMDKEIEQLPEGEAKLKGTSLEDIPLVVISPSMPEMNATELGFSEEEEQAFAQAWKESQMELLELSSDSRMMVVYSSHAVMYDQPEVIVEAVLSLR